ncbi:MAG TPA: hypothetical protein VGP92_08770, partial [Acidimicrobiia bacterium]|nr:hypothetical protein [Acidimicrobiia bacterium]
TSLREFIESMAEAGNPGSGRHDMGVHHVHGWILEYDPTVGGSQIQAVIGVDGLIHALREPRSVRTRTLSASEWVQRDGDDVDATTRASRFADHLSRIGAFDHAGPDVPNDDPSRWGPALGR